MHEISIRAEEIFHIGSFAVTNSLIMSLLASGVLLAAAFLIRRSLSAIPGKLQSILEIVLEEVLRIMENIFGSRKTAEEYLPIIATVFLFILTSNWLGLLPIVGPIGVYESAMAEHGKTLVPLFRSPASDLNFTIALAIISVIGVNFFAVLALGIRAHAGKFFTLKNPIYTFVGLLEFLSEFVKIISFSFRLFGNVFAGEVLLTIVGFLAPYFLPLPFLFLEVFVGLVQAFIFATLTLVFLAMSIKPHEEYAH